MRLTRDLPAASTEKDRHKKAIKNNNKQKNGGIFPFENSLVPMARHGVSCRRDGSAVTREHRCACGLCVYNRCDRCNRYIDTMDTCARVMSRTCHLHDIALVPCHARSFAKIAHKSFQAKRVCNPNTDKLVCKCTDWSANTQPSLYGRLNHLISTSFVD